MKTPPKKEPAPLVNPFSRLGWFQKFLLSIGLIILVMTALPAVLIIMIGLLPTITLMMTDRKNTAKLTIVGCFNLAGVFVCLMNIFSQFEVSHALSILGNIFNLIIMLGSAALGVIIYYELPGIFIGMSKMSAEKRLDGINGKLKKLADEWGADIVSLPDFTDSQSASGAEKASGTPPAKS